MATLQKIRNKAGVLVAVVIGLALLAFILGDLLNSGPSVFSRKRLEVAEIDGKSINYMDYNAKIEKLSDFYRTTYQMQSLDQQTLDGIRQEVWQNTVRDIILNERIKKLGIYVSDDELKTMLLGDSINTGGSTVITEEPHPIVRRMFTNPETGEFNRYQMMNYFNAISNDVYKNERKRWIYIEDQIINDRLSQKYFTLVRKGLSPNTLDARDFALETGSSVDFSFVHLPFNTIPDDAVSVGESDIRDYYENHKHEYRQDESRSIEYVVFDVKPSDKDDQMAHDYVSQSKVTFARTDNPIDYVNSNSDIPYKDINYGYNDLPESIRDSIFDASPGFVAGPYYDQNSYKLARLLEFVYVPDSVRARHILISLSAQRDDARAKAIADSLKNLIDNGHDFASLALDYSADQSNRKIGGDLGWFKEGDMVKPFSDAVFNGNVGDVDVVKTRFGYHVIKIIAQSKKVKKAKLAILEREVIPSDETYQKIYSQAVEFRSKATSVKNFRDLCVEDNITPRFATDIKKNATDITGLDNSRELIRWAYENDENTISQIFDLTDKYVVAALTDVKKKGYAPLEDVKTEIEIKLTKEKKLDALASQINDKISGASTIDDAAVALNTTVSEASKVRFANPYVNGVGLEPAIVAKAFEMPENTLSGPVKGENGVFVMIVTNRTIPENPDIQSAEFRLKYAMQSRVAYEGYDALKENADIVDNRIKFY